MSTNSRSSELTRVVAQLGLEVVDREGETLHIRGAGAGAGAGPPRSVSLVGPLLRVTAHEILPPDVDANALADRLGWSGDWLVGRVYYDPWARHWAASTGAYVPQLLSARQLEASVQTLDAGIEALRRGDRPPRTTGDVEPATAMATVAGLLDRLGVGYQRSNAGELLTLRIAAGPDGGPAVRLDLFVLDGARLVARARVDPPRSLPSIGQTYLALNQLQAQIEVGVVGFAASRGEPFAALALAWPELDGDSTALSFMIHYAHSLATILPS